jgi:hypothetical protein
MPNESNQRAKPDVNVGGDVAGRDISIGGNVGGNIVIGNSNIVNNIVTHYGEATFGHKSITLYRQLPNAAPYFTGRESEITQLLNAIGEEPMRLALFGMAGVGKTALALRLVEELTILYPDAQLFLDLRGTSQDPLLPADAMKQIIKAYQPTKQLQEKGGAITAFYANILKGQRALIVLDDVANAEQVRDLISPTSCLFLITSRRKLALSSLHTMDLDVLTREDASKLLLKIAPRIDKRADAIADLCGGLPAALDLIGTLIAQNADLSLDTIERDLKKARKQ